MLQKSRLVLITTVIMNLLSSKYCLSANNEKSANESKPNGQSNGYEEALMNPENLDLFFQSTALITLLRAKAKAIFMEEPNLPNVERVIFEQCADEARNVVVSLARCVVTLMKARDTWREAASIPSVNTVRNSTNNEDFLTMIGRYFSTLFGGGDNTETSVKTEKHSNISVSERIALNETHVENREIRCKERSWKRREKDRRISIYSADRLPSSISFFKGSTRLHRNRSGRAKRNVNLAKYEIIEKVRYIQEYLDMTRYCNKHFRAVTRENAEYLKKYDASAAAHNFDVKEDLPDDDYETSERLREELQRINDDASMAILSPQLFSLFSSGGWNNGTKDGESRQNGTHLPSSLNHLLSPQLFSFHKEGLFSLHNMFWLFSTKEEDTLEWIEMMLRRLGIGRILDAIVRDMGPRMDHVRVVLYPTVRRLELYQQRFRRVRNTFSAEQMRQLDMVGYTIMTTAQHKMLKMDRSDVNLKADSDQLTKEKRRERRDFNRHSLYAMQLDSEQSLEEDIRHLADFSNYMHLISTHPDADHLLRSMRSRRRAPMFPDSGPDSAVNKPDETLFHKKVHPKVVDHLAKIRLLRNFAFTNRLRDGLAMNTVVLSPGAFLNTVNQPLFYAPLILSPRVLSQLVLSPRLVLSFILSPFAFFANVLSPFSIMLDVFSPRAFQMNVLSPRFIGILVMSPRFMLFEVLSPKMIEGRVFNSAFFFVRVLTPFFMVPRVFSPPIFGVHILSPVLLSPSINSKGIYLRVLSPTIFSGDLDLFKHHGNLNDPNFLPGVLFTSNFDEELPFLRPFPFPLQPSG